MKKRVFELFFLCVAFFAYSTEFDLAKMHVFSDETGSFHILNAEFLTNSKQNNLKKGLQFNFKLNYSNAKSTLPIFQGNFENLLIQPAIKNDFFLISPTFGVFFTDNFSSKKTSDSKSFSLKNKGIRFSYARIYTQFNVNSISISPFVYFANLSFEKTDFYYFIGNIKTNYSAFYGLNAKMKNHKLTLFGLNSQNTVNNFVEQQLFLSKLNSCGIFFSHFSAKEDLFSFEPFLGFSYLSENLFGALTIENQKALYFVFDYYNVDFDFGVIPFIVGCNGKYKNNKFEINYSFVNFLFFFENSSIKRQWKKLENLPSWLESTAKSFFIDQATGEASDKLNLINNCGVSLIHCDFRYHFTKNLSARISKSFVIPFDLEKLNMIINFTKQDVINYLLSGICISARFSF